MTRRQFAFWLGLGLFNLAEKLRANCLDDLAAVAMRATEEKPAELKTAEVNTPAPATHWTAAENRTWRWFERETFVDGKWKVTGITTPINKHTGERYAGASGYLDDELVPAEVRDGYHTADIPDPEETGADAAPGVATVTRRARHGRPPSRWLRSLKADELRVWLKKIDVPEAGVEGMTYWEHLTRDHAFNPTKIAGLNIDEQAKLHAAAHYGY
jgi:hypothetical protein